MKKAIIDWFDAADHRYWLKVVAFTCPVNIILDYQLHARGWDAVVLAWSVFVLSFFFVKPVKKEQPHE